MRTPHTLLAPLALATLALMGCGGGATTPPASTGSIVLSISGGPALAAVTRVALSVTPAGVTSDLLPDPATGAFTGTLSLPVGLQAITARAYADATLVAEGSASVTVTGGQALSVTITVLDVTGPEPTPDHGPVLTSLTASALTLDVGQTLSLTAAAIDVDGDIVTYTWSALPAGCATFSPDITTGGASASTTATAALAGACAISVRAEALGLADTLSTTVDLLLPVVIGGIFVPQPVIGSVEFLSPATASVLRTTSDATLRHAWAPGTPVSVMVSWDEAPWLDRSTATLVDSCGGTVVSTATTTSTETFDWTPTGGPVCLLTAAVQRQGLSDDFPVAVIVGAVPPGTCTWTQVAFHDLTTLPADIVPTNGGAGGQGPAVVAGRTAWLQTSDWNELTLASPFGQQDVLAMQAEVFLPAVTSTGFHASLQLLRDGEASGLMATLTSLDAATTSLDWWLAPTPIGSFDRRTAVTVSHDTWHTFRLEASRSTCAFRVLLDGIELDRLVTGCTTAGSVSRLSSNGLVSSPTNVAWSNLTLETGAAACAP